MATSDVLDQTKENVQPLRKGRNVAHLGTVLQAQDSPEAQLELDHQREQYELSIHVYEGDDPLQPRYDFVRWIEQSYPTLGHESKLIPLLEDTINLFKDCDQYKQDVRFVELLVKYISFQLSPVELYQLAYNQGLGTKCALLYLAWAEELEKNQDWKSANKIYDLGISNNAEPFEDLQRYQEQFQLCLGRHMMLESINALPTDSSFLPHVDNAACQVNQQRRALSRIHKSSVIGTRVPRGNPGVLQSMSNHMENARSVINIYQGNSESNFGGNSVRAKVDQFPKDVITNKENSLKPGPWKNKNSSQKLRSSAPPVPIVPSTPSFQVHQDEEKVEMPYMTPIVPRVLKPIRAETFNCPVAIFEPLDSTVRVMYPKHKIYVGGREFQLEELKAAVYNKRYNQKVAGELGIGTQTPLPFSKQATSYQIVDGLATPSFEQQKMVPVRLFEDKTPAAEHHADRNKEALDINTPLKHYETTANGSSCNLSSNNDLEVDSEIAAFNCKILETKSDALNFTPCVNRLGSIRENETSPKVKLIDSNEEDEDDKSSKILSSETAELKLPEPEGDDKIAGSFNSAVQLPESKDKNVAKKTSNRGPAKHTMVPIKKPSFFIYSED